MRTSLSPAELALLRTRPQAAKYYLAVHRAPVTLLAQLSPVPNNFPGSVIQLAGIASGLISDASPGMTVRIGTSPNESDLGLLRVRKASTGTMLAVSEYGSGLVDFRSGACVTVMEEFLPWPIHPTYASATSAWQVDLDNYTSQTIRYGPMALMGPPHAGFMPNGTMTASYVGDRSYAITPGTSITSQSWKFSNGQTVTSALGTSLNPIVVTYNNASSGGRYNSLTVTDGNGNSHIGYRLNFGFNTSAGEPHRVRFENITGGLRSGGYRTRLYVDTSGGSTFFPDGAQIVIFENASYGTAGSSVGGNYFGRNNIVMVGWIAQDSMRVEPFTGEVSFEVETIDGQLARTAAYDIFLESGSAASSWDMASGLTIDRAAVVLAKYRSTIANIVDMNLAGGTASTNEVPFRALAAGNLWQQLQYNYQAVFGLVAADLQSSIYAQPDVQITGGSANLPNVMDITFQDRRDSVIIEHEHKQTCSLQRLYAIQGGTTSPLGSTAPGDRQGFWGMPEEVTGNLTVPDQDTLITWAGNKFATENNPFKRITIPLAGNMRIDSVPQCRVTMSLSPTKNVKSLNWSNKVLLPYETNISYDPNAGVVTELVAEQSVSGIGGSSITFPRDLTHIDPLDVSGNLDVVATPVFQGGAGNNMFGISGSTIFRTTDFFSISPTWVDITGTVTGTALVVKLDPYDPANRAKVMTTNGIWYSANILAASPTWTQTLSLANMRTATHASAVFNLPTSGNGAMMSATTSQWYIGIIVGVFLGGSSYQWWYGRTTDYILGTWTFTSIDSTSAIIPGSVNAAGFWLSQHNTSNIFFSPGYKAAVPNKDKAALYYSTDGGATWSVEYAGAGDAQQFVLFVPYSGNASDNIIFGGTAGGPGSKVPRVYKTTTGIGGWSDITYSSGSYYYGPIYEDSITESPASVTAGTNIYVACRRFTGATDGGSAFLSYNGSAWTVIQENTTANNRSWAGAGLGGWPYNNSKLQMHNAGFGSGKVGRTEDGGVTWIDATGNLATITGGGAVSYLVPIWTL